MRVKDKKLKLFFVCFNFWAWFSQESRIEKRKIVILFTNYFLDNCCFYCILLDTCVTSSGHIKQITFPFKLTPLFFRRRRKKFFGFAKRNVFFSIGNLKNSKLTLPLICSKKSRKGGQFTLYDLMQEFFFLAIRPTKRKTVPNIRYDDQEHLYWVFDQDWNSWSSFDLPFIAL